MRLNKLEVYGFKSFADPTDFVFEPGVTAVVGPNGCGKSNVVDAIKWILGEQSAKSLRGKEMMDVIFNGSGTRKSLGFAEATLAFEDLQTSEGRLLPQVEITRRLYRSGESEYLINREGARLKDIRDLFLDTGVGMQAYSIIEQGRIDAILTRSPQDRRAIFEEAAGISRYKKKRLESERKLERTDGNLLRVGDRIEEIERRLRSLKSQASKARRYREHEARLKELRVRHSLHQYAELKGQIETLRVQLAEREREVESKRAAAELFESEATEQETLAREIDAQLEDLARARTEIELRISQAGAEMEHGEAMITEISGSTERHQREITGLEEHNHTDRRELDGLAKEHAALRLETTEARTRLEQVRSEDTAVAGGMAERRREAAAAALQLAALAARRAELRDRSTDLTARRAAAEENRARLEARRDALGEEMERLKADRDARDAEVSRLADTIGAMTRVYHEREEAARQAERVVEELGESLGRASELYHGRLSRRELLAGLVERHEGLAGAVQEVLRAAAAGTPEVAAVCGLVADVVETAPEHYAAVEAALDHEAETVICRDRAGAGAVAAWLERAGAGRLGAARARLLAGDCLGRAEHSAARAAARATARAEPGVTGELRAHVRIGRFATDGGAAASGCFRSGADGRFLTAGDGHFAPARPLTAEQSTRLASATVDELLGDVLLAESTERAYQLAARYPTLRFVTAAGNLAGGAAVTVAGPAAAAPPAALPVTEPAELLPAPASEGPLVAPGLIAQRNELRRISHLVEEQARRVDEVKAARMRRAGELAEIEDTLQRLRGEIYDANIEHTEKRTAFRHFEQSIRARRQEHDDAQESILKVADSVARLAAQAAQFEEESVAADAGITGLEERARHIATELAEQTGRREQLAESMREIEVTMTRAGEQTASLARAMRGIEAAIGERRNRVERLQKEGAESQTRIAAARERIAAALQRRGEHEVERGVLAARFQEVERSRDATRQRIAVVRVEVRTAREAAEHASEEAGKLRLAENEARVHKEALALRVLDEYGLELETLLQKRLRARAIAAGELAPEEAPQPASPAEDSAPVVEASGLQEGAAPPVDPAAAAAERAAREAAFFAAEDGVDWQAVDAEIQELKEKMANLGNVNLEAIEEYDEVEKRFAEMVAQRDDLADAKAKLEQLIAELNSKSRDLFITTLEVVRENFKEMFRKLFGGGNGDIVIGEGDPLDAGIDIIAKPPGKEPASISLLSGGEKSMTAVALLFALFKSKPSPFCILDEVDAALDEANVTRFVTLLKEFLTSTQFIIITHNKRTMAVADAIHGVTMQESGVSKRISVKFEEVA